MALIDFRLPDVGEGIDGADVRAWQVAEGERVEEDQPLVEIETDKAVVVIPSPATGVLRHLGAQAGDRLAVGEVLAVIEPESAGDSAAPAAPAPAAPAAAPVRAAPATRKLARERGIDLDAVTGSGLNGRITREDVEAASGDARAHADAGPPGDEVVPMRGVRRAVARTLTRAWREIPHMTDYREVDATRLIEARTVLRERALGRGDEALARAMTPTPLIVKAAARALADHPYVNASIDSEREQIVLHREINVGIATATPDGLMVPVVHRADARSVVEIAREVADLAAAARERRLRPDQLAGGTFTVDNYGGLGIWLGTPIVRPPEVAILGVGAIRDRVVAVDGAPRVRPIVALAVSADHRVLDGDTLAAFVTHVAGLLEEPLALLGDLR